MAFDRYLAASTPAPAIGVPEEVQKAAGTSAAGYQQQFQQEATRPFESPRVDATRVQAGAVAQAKATNQPTPIFKKGDFGFVYKDAKSIPSHYNPNETLGSTIEFQDIGEGRTVSVIASNTALANVDPKANTTIPEDILAAHTDKQRKAVLMKMALDGNLGQNVRVSPEDAEEAGRLWITPSNKHKQFEIEKAWALVKQNTAIGSVGSTNESDQFTLRTRQKFGMTPSEYMINGYSSNVRGTVIDERGRDASEDVQDEIKRREIQVRELEDKFFKKGDETNPHTEAIAKKREDYSYWSAILARQPEGTSAAKQTKDRLATINTEITQLNVASTSWEAQQQQNQRRLEEGRKGLKDLLERVQGVASNTQLKAGIEMSRDTGKSIQRWTGTAIKDYQMHLGYTAKAMDDIDPALRYQYIIDNSITRKPDETAEQFNKRRKVLDRTDNPELMWWLAKNAPAKFEELSQTMPTEEEIKQSKTTTEMLVNNSYHFEQLFDINERLRNAGFIEGFTMKNFSADVKAAASARSNLIGQMRVFIVGPGNPSNFEQEILHSIIPEIDATFSVAKFHKERLRALAMISILAHHNEKTKLGFKASDSSVAFYNQRFAKLLGKKITMDDIERFKDFSDREADAYYQMKQVGNIDVGDRQGGNYGTGKMTTASYGTNYFNKATDFLNR